MHIPLLTADPAGTDLMSGLASYLPIILIFGLAYFVLIRPQKKKDKEIQEMRKQTQVGDEVMTAGGVLGLIVSMKDDSVVIETGPARNKIRIARWAIQQNITASEAAEAERAKRQQEQAEKKKK